MKLLIKKTAILSTLIVGSIAIAGSGLSEQFNTVLKDVLNPLNTETTQIEITTDELIFSENSLKNLDFNFNYKKEGLVNTLNLKSNISYQSTLESTSVEAQAGFKLNLAKAFGQQTLNILAPELSELASDLIQQNTEVYGENIEIDAKVFDEVYDDNGNVVGLKFNIDIVVNLENLSKDLLARTFLKSGSLNVAFTQGGFDISGMASLNKDWEFFKSENSFIKDHFDKILKKDSETLDGIYNAYSFLDSYIQQFVDTDNSNN